MKYKTSTGKNKWRESTIRGILKNEKYKGDVLQGKMTPEFMIRLEKRLLKNFDIA